MYRNAFEWLQAESRLNKEGFIFTSSKWHLHIRTRTRRCKLSIDMIFQILFALIESANNVRVLLIEGVPPADVYLHFPATGLVWSAAWRLMPGGVARIIGTVGKWPPIPVVDALWWVVRSYIVNRLSVFQVIKRKWTNGFHSFLACAKCIHTSSEWSLEITVNRSDCVKFMNMTVSDYQSNGRPWLLAMDISHRRSGEFINKVSIVYPDEGYNY